MFDVYWTDHNRERVGEKIIRKDREEREAKTKQGDGRNHESLHHSISTNSTASNERAFGLFASKGRKRVATRSRVDYTTSLSASPIDTSREGNDATFDVNRFDTHGDISESSASYEGNAFLPVKCSRNVDDCSSPSSRESIFSKWTPSSLITASTLPISSPRTSVASKSDQFVQTLGPSSFVVKTTQVMIAPRSIDCDIDRLMSQVHISSERVKAPTPLLEDLPEEAAPMPFDDSDSAFLLTRFPLPGPSSELQSGSDELVSAEKDNEHLDPNAWRLLPGRDCTVPQDKLNAYFEERAQCPEGHARYISPNLAAMQREICMMAAASPELMLANIKSEMREAADAAVYKELEMAKKRWVFSALHKNENYAARLHQGSFIPRTQNPELPARILTVCETHASITFLAALHSDVQISHLSPSPISTDLFPNVQPMFLPTVTASAVSRLLPRRVFSSVTCLLMPSLFPSSDIPPFLRSVHRCLSAGGALHLTIVDPEPVSSSMGPKLRQWLIENLLVNLEQTFRTTLPSCTLPTWLAVSRLRGKGSTIVSLSIPAVSESFSKIKGVQDPGPVKGELRCEVLRMLWREVWGNFVHAKRWWWEEEQILDECTTFGTYWVYSHIIAVKED